MNRIETLLNDATEICRRLGVDTLDDALKKLEAMA